jgi:cyclopropane-fatty-acyl-phospholipid synthase
MLSSMLQRAENSQLPDSVIRFGIKRLLRQRLQSLRSGNPAEQEEGLWDFISEMRKAVVAVDTDAANKQHYEVPSEFYESVLGSHMKYSSAFYPKGTETLSEAEDAMLRLMEKRTQLEDGQRVLDLGCGWGSFSLWAAARFPKSQFLAISNSRTQKQWIDLQSQRRGISNLRVETQNAIHLELKEDFDRIVSVEMFEHMRNWESLLSKLASHLAKDGKLFIHIFTHREHPYLFETEGDHNWMGREFFTGGMMPSHRLIFHIQSPFHVERSWVVPGTHYGKTSRAWLENLDRNRESLRSTLQSCYGDQSDLWMQRWRIFFMACEELFSYRDGSEWWVSHYRLAK